MLEGGGSFNIGDGIFLSQRLDVPKSLLLRNRHGMDDERLPSMCMLAPSYCD